MHHRTHHPVPTWLVSLWAVHDYVLLAILLALAVFVASLSVLRDRTPPLPPVEGPPFQIVTGVFGTPALAAGAGAAEPRTQRRG